MGPVAGQVRAFPHASRHLPPFVYYLYIPFIPAERIKQDYPQIYSYNKTVIKTWVKGQEFCEEEPLRVCVSSNFVPDTWFPESQIASTRRAFRNKRASPVLL